MGVTGKRQSGLSDSKAYAFKLLPTLKGDSLMEEKTAPK